MVVEYFSSVKVNMANVDLDIYVVEKDSYGVKVFSFNSIDKFLIAY